MENAYADPQRAEAYASLAFPGTYHLAFRDLPGLLADEVRGTRALDFGCGAGRSTRFLRGLGYDVVGVDIAPAMLDRARQLDPAGDYRLFDDDPRSLPPGPFDLVLAAFPFDNIPDVAHRVDLLRGLRERMRTGNGAGDAAPGSRAGDLAPGSRAGDSASGSRAEDSAPESRAEDSAPESRAGDSASGSRLVLIASSPELYVNEWATFTTAAFPENARARSGETVRIVVKVGGDPRPVEDLLWRDDDYTAAFTAAGLAPRFIHRPLGRPDDGYPWLAETRIPPWALHVAAPA